MMKFNDKKISKLFTQSKLPQRPINVENGDLIFPFEIKTGYVDATNGGYVFDNRVEDYSRFERIFTGYEAILAVWENSTSLITNADNTKLVKNYQSGSAILGKEDFSNNVNQFDEFDVNTNFQVERDVIQVKYNVNIDFTEADVLKLYTIPSKYGNTLFRVDSIVEHPYNDKGDIAYSTLNLVSVNNILAETGLSINQYIQFSAPGEGYASPLLIDRIKVGDDLAIDYVDETQLPTPIKGGKSEYVVLSFKNEGLCIVKYNFDTKKWNTIANRNGYTIDETKLKTRPITNIQIEVFGKGILNDFYFMGRPLNKTNNSNGDVIENSRYLLPYKGASPITSQQEATRPLARNTSYYVIKRGQLDLLSWYKNWKESIVAEANIAKTKEWSGVIKVKYGDYKGREPGFWEKLGYSIVNGPVAFLAGSGWTDSFWNPMDEHITLSQNMVSLQEDANGVIELSTMMVQNFFRNKNVLRLPMHYTETIAWTLKDIPIIGGLLDKLSLGLPVAWATSTNLGGKNFNIKGIISQALMDFFINGVYGVKKIGDEAYTPIPLDALEDSSEVFMSDGEFSTSSRVFISDKFKNVRPNGYNGIMVNENVVLNTKDIGVRLDGESDEAFKQRQMILDAIVPQEKDATTDGYAIDIWGLHFIGKGDVKITFLDEHDEAVYTTFFKTTSKLTKSVRDWNTTIKGSAWEYTGNANIDNRQVLLPTTNIYSPSKNTWDGKAFDPTNDITDGLLRGETTDTGQIKTDATGNQTNVKAVDNLIDGKLHNTPALQPSTLSKIQKVNLYTLSAGVSSGKPENFAKTTKNIKELLEKVGYRDQGIIKFDRITTSFDLTGTTIGTTFFGNIGSAVARGFLIKAQQFLRGKTLTFNIVKSGSTYTLQLAQGQTFSYTSDDGEIFFEIDDKGNMSVKGDGGDVETSLFFSLKDTTITAG